MMPRTGTTLTLLALLVLCAVALPTGCTRTPQARFYTLSTLVGTEHTAPGTALQAPQTVGVGPIALPSYLNTKSITTRTGPTSLSRSELHRWGGSLENEVDRVMVSNLNRLLADRAVIVLPWLEATRNDLQVQVSIARFEGDLQHRVVLDAEWLVFSFSGSSRTLRTTGTVSINDPVTTDGYDALTESMSRALAHLCRRIAVDIGRELGSTVP